MVVDEAIKFYMGKSFIPVIFITRSDIKVTKSAKLLHFIIRWRWKPGHHKIKSVCVSGTGEDIFCQRWPSAVVAMVTVAVAMVTVCCCSSVWVGQDKRSFLQRLSYCLLYLYHIRGKQLVCLYFGGFTLTCQEVRAIFAYSNVPHSPWIKQL